MRDSSIISLLLSAGVEGWEAGKGEGKDGVIFISLSS
jgi:hypothetical protein